MKIQKEVIIVGAGLTGAITASYIKARFPQYRIKMIHTSTDDNLACFGARYNKRM